MVAKANLEKELTEKINQKILEINELKNELKTKEEFTQNKLEKVGVDGEIFLSKLTFIYDVKKILGEGGVKS